VRCGVTDGYKTDYWNAIGTSDRLFYCCYKQTENIKHCEWRVTNE